MADNYFKYTYLYSKKKSRIFLIDEFYKLKQLKKENNHFLEKIENNFYNKWSNFIE